MPAPSSPQWSGFLEPYGHRQPWEPFEPCPSWKKLAPIAPPPPRPQPACRPAQPTGDTLTVEARRALFDAMRIEPTKRPRVKREPRPVRVEVAVTQLQLFTAEGRLWCELRETGLRLVSENSQGEWSSRHDQDGDFCLESPAHMVMTGE